MKWWGLFLGTAVLTMIVVLPAALAIAQNGAINPAAPTVAPQSGQSAANAAAITRAVNAAFAALPSDTGAVYLSLASGQAVRKNDTSAFTAASTIKLLIMAAVYQQARAGQLSLDAQRTVKEVVSGSQCNDTRGGQTLKVRDAARNMMRCSDNTLANLLIDLVGKDTINKFGSSLGLKQTKLNSRFSGAAGGDGPENTTSAADLAELLRRIYRGELVSSAASREMLGFLKDHQAADYLGAGLSPRPAIAHVSGSIAEDQVFHDAGILLVGGGQDYVLAILTNDASTPLEASNLIGKASQTIYQAVKSGGSSVSTPTTGTGGEIVIPVTDGQFRRSGPEQYWKTGNVGYNSGTMYWTYGWGTDIVNAAEWRPTLKAGRYEVFVWIPRNFAGSTSAPYKVHHANGITLVNLNQDSYSDEWISLGTYTFEAGNRGYLELTDDTGEDLADRAMLGFDAARFTPR